VEKVSTSAAFYDRQTVWKPLLVGLTVCGAALGLVACDASTRVQLTGRVVTNAEGKAVLQDWYDGRISDGHSCGAVVVASSHLPVDGPIYSTVAADLARYAAKVCTHHPNLQAGDGGCGRCCGCGRAADTGQRTVLGVLEGEPEPSGTDGLLSRRPGRQPRTGVPLVMRAFLNQYLCSDWRLRDAVGTGGVLLVVVVSVAGLGSARAAAAARGYRFCDLSRLRATAGLQGATGSMLGGLSVGNLGPTCTLAGRPLVELVWHGRRVTPSQKPFDPRAFRSIGPFHASRTLAHGTSLFVRLQWWNYCGAKLWGNGGFRPVASLRVQHESGLVQASSQEAVVPPFCNSAKYAPFSVSDFGVTP
jgi:hypothetical protein